MSQHRMTRQEVARIIDQVRFMDRKFRLLEKGDGFLVQMRYLEADVEHPEKGLQIQATRKWYVSPYMTESEVLETVWAMVQRSQLHVASEHFTYKGKRVYSQHFSVKARLTACEQGCFDVRQPIESDGTNSNG